MDVDKGTAGAEDSGAEGTGAEDAGGVGTMVAVAADLEEALDSEAATGQ